MHSIINKKLDHTIPGIFLYHGTLVKNLNSITLPYQLLWSYITIYTGCIDFYRALPGVIINTIINCLFFLFLILNEYLLNLHELLLFKI